MLLREYMGLTSEAFTPHCGTPSSGFSARVSIEMVLGLGLALLLNKTFAFQESRGL